MARVGETRIVLGHREVYTDQGWAEVVWAGDSPDPSGSRSKGILTEPYARKNHGIPFYDIPALPSRPAASPEADSSNPKPPPPPDKVAPVRPTGDRQTKVRSAIRAFWEERAAIRRRAE